MPFARLTLPVSFALLVSLTCNCRPKNSKGSQLSTAVETSAEVLDTAPPFDPAVRHPLDDLTAQEIADSVAIAKEAGKVKETTRFVVVNTLEPPKAEVIAGPSGIVRQALVVLYDLQSRSLSELTVDLAGRKVTNQKNIPGAQPSIMLDEFDRAAEAVKADPQWQAAIRKRGISNFDEVAVDGWAPGLLSESERSSGLRIMRGLAYYQGDSTNYYARPIEGVVAVVDVGAGKVIEVIDTGVVPIAKGKQQFDEASNGPVRNDLTPLVTDQPNGPSFAVQGQQIIWQNWRFRYSFQPMKGLVLYQVGFEDQGKMRSIAYKISLSEMLVPYSAAPRTWSFRNAFDVGEYGIGRTAHSLDPLVDVPATAKFFDAHFADESGEPVTIKRAVAVYERAPGLMWKHNDVYVGKSQARPARQLVVTFMTTVGNYDYGINYILHQDGAIEVESQLTGILLAQGTALETNPCSQECTQLVEKNVIAPPHQHFFAFRLDLDIDGVANDAYETTVEQEPVGGDNPDGNVFKAVNRLIATEADTVGSMDLALQRKWKVASHETKNALGHPTGYKIMPGINSRPYLHQSSSILQRGAFINRHMWFTRYHDDEQSAAGDYPNQGLAGAGLPTWTNGEDLTNQDVVAWYVFGITHIPRPEEWPIMNVERGGFQIAPINFFSRNPVMNLPAVPQAQIDAAISRTAARR